MIDWLPMKAFTSTQEPYGAGPQGGVTWAELNRETQHNGLAVTGGWSRAQGLPGSPSRRTGAADGQVWLALDNLRSVELVTAEARSCEQARMNTHLSGPFAGRRQLRCGDFLRISTPSGRAHGHGRPDRTPVDRARDLLKFFRDSTASLRMSIDLRRSHHAPDGRARSWRPW